MIDTALITDARLSYQLEIATDAGVVIATPRLVGPFEYMRIANDYGYFSIQLPDDFDRSSYITRDQRIVLWRKTPGGSRYREFQGIIRRIVTSGTKSVTTIQGYDFNYLLTKRAILYASGESESSKTDYADDMIKAVVRENLGASAGAGRLLNATYFTVDDDHSAAPSITLAFAWRDVLSALQGIAKASRTAGTNLFFEIAAQDSTQVRFYTFIDQIGTDRSEDRKSVV